MRTSTGREIRKSAIAGTWYPGHATELTRTLDEFLFHVPPGLAKGRLIGLISPHAGYAYSGQTAAYAYKQLENLHFDTVAIVSPVHRMYLGPIMINDCAYYETPLGLVEVDRQMIVALEERISVSRVEWDDEHSLEIQLPFLQRLLGDFKLLPVMQGDQSLSTSERLASALAELLRGKNALLVASTDLSHFHSYKAAVQLDEVAKQVISDYDPLALNNALEHGTTEACGGGPVISVMLAARALGANQAQVLDYRNSGDVTGDRSRVVGYLAAAIYQASE
jgi:AmmeMemoRadiSam system protein B